MEFLMLKKKQKSLATVGRLGRESQMQLACTLAICVCWIMKSMNKVIVGETIFRCGVNLLTKVLEYSIKELRNGV